MISVWFIYFWPLTLSVFPHQQLYRRMLRTRVDFFCSLTIQNIQMANPWCWTNTSMINPQKMHRLVSAWHHNHCCYSAFSVHRLKITRHWLKYPFFFSAMQYKMSFSLSRQLENNVSCVDKVLVSNLQPFCCWNRCANFCVLNIGVTESWLIMFVKIEKYFPSNQKHMVRDRFTKINNNFCWSVVNHESPYYTYVFTIQIDDESAVTH